MRLDGSLSGYGLRLSASLALAVWMTFPMAAPLFIGRRLVSWRIRGSVIG